MSSYQNAIFILSGIWFFMCGCAMGSFYNVLIDRLPSDQPVIFSRSECSFCHTTLSWKDLIPVFSYIFLRGKCRYCGKKLSPQYLFSELSVGALFLLGFFVYIKEIDLPHLLMLLALWSMLFITAVMDYKSGVVMDCILIIFSVLGVILRLWAGCSIKTLLISAALGFGFYGLIYLAAWVFYKKEGFGFGDVLLLTACGVFLEPVQTVIGGLLAFYCSLLFIAAGRLISKESLKDRALPFAPPICTAVFIMSLFGDQITAWLYTVTGIY